MQQAKEALHTACISISTSPFFWAYFDHMKTRVMCIYE